MIGSLASRFSSGIALASIGLFALCAQAPPQPTFLHYDTAITEVYGSQYPLTGKLDFEIFPDGTLRGYYHTSFYKLYIPVAGGRDGSYIWFDIGPSSIDLGLGAGPQGKLHVVATMNGDNSFRGQVYPETAAVLSGLSMQYQFSSPSPTSQNVNEQYIFNATPTPGPAALPMP